MGCFLDAQCQSYSRDWGLLEWPVSAFGQFDPFPASNPRGIEGLCARRGEQAAVVGIESVRREEISSRRGKVARASPTVSRRPGRSPGRRVGRRRTAFSVKEIL